MDVYGQFLDVAQQNVANVHLVVSAIILARRKSSTLFKRVGGFLHSLEVEKSRQPPSHIFKEGDDVAE